MYGQSASGQRISYVRNPFEWSRLKNMRLLLAQQGLTQEGPTLLHQLLKGSFCCICLVYVLVWVELSLQVLEHFFPIIERLASSSIQLLQHILSERGGLFICRLLLCRDRIG